MVAIAQGQPTRNLSDIHRPLYVSESGLTRVQPSR